MLTFSSWARHQTLLNSKYRFKKTSNKHLLRFNFIQIAMKHALVFPLHFIFFIESSFIFIFPHIFRIRKNDEFWSSLLSGKFRVCAHWRSEEKFLLVEAEPPENMA